MFFLFEGNVREVETGVYGCLGTRGSERFVEGDVAGEENDGGGEFEFVADFDDSEQRKG